MKHAREIKIQKLQTKNRMVGQTFNPSGHTKESLSKRELDWIEKVKKMTLEEYEKYRLFCVWQNKSDGSNLFETNVFIRNFGLNKKQP